MGKKIVVVLFVVVLTVCLGRLGLGIFEQAKTRPYKVLRKIETIVNKLILNILGEEKEMNKHMFYVSTPIGSVGIL